MFPHILLIICTLSSTLADDDIKIKIYSVIEKTPNITFKGVGVNVVTPAIKKLFGFNEWNGIAVLRATGLKLSTVHMDNKRGIHDKNNCSLVKRIIKPLNQETVVMNSKPEHSMIHYFENDSQFPAEYYMKIAYRTTQNVSTSWTNQKDQTYGGGVGVETTFAEVVGTATMSIGVSASYSTSYGETQTKSESKQVGSETGIRVTLPPNKSAVAEIEAEVGKLKIRVEYESKLVGDLVVTFTNKTVKCWPVGEVMALGNYNNTYESVEMIDIDFFSTAKVVLYDFDEYQSNHGGPGDKPHEHV